MLWELFRRRTRSWFLSFKKFFFIFFHSSSEAAFLYRSPRFCYSLLTLSPSRYTRSPRHSHFTISRFGRMSLFLFLLAKGTLVFSRHFHFVVLRPSFSIRRVQCGQAFLLKRLLFCFPLISAAGNICHFLSTSFLLLLLSCYTFLNSVLPSISLSGRNHPFFSLTFYVFSVFRRSDSTARQHWSHSKTNSKESSLCIQGQTAYKGGGWACWSTSRWCCLRKEMFLKEA